MPSEQYAVPAGRRPVVAAAALVPPALVGCAVVGVAAQLHRVYAASQLGLALAGDPGPAPPLALQVGTVLSDPSTSGPALAAALALVTLVGLHLLRPSAVPVGGGTRRAGALVAGVVSLLNLLLTVVVVVWVATTHGSVVGDDDFQATFELDPWDTLLGHGSLGLLSCVVGAGAVLLLTTHPTAPATPAPAAGAPVDGRVPDAEPTPSTGPAHPAASAGAVVLASTPVPDPQAFRRPARPRPVRPDGSTGRDEGGSGAPAVSAEDGYRRPAPGAARPG